MTMKENTTNIDYAFSDIYVTYYPKLVRFAKEYVGMNEEAENLVQDIFLQLWSKSALLESMVNVNAFLFAMVKNRSIDFLRSKIVEENRNKSLVEVLETQITLEALEEFDERKLGEKDIESVIQEAIDSLPERCREIFVMHKLKRMKYAEIATVLNLSVKTVDNQMGIALKKLRVKLKDYVPLFIFMVSV